ncbi:F-box family protein, partial [Trifolium medium]|nr:F-box family protein [Trifolium medium]
MPQGIGRSHVHTSLGFGYDHVNDNYKVVAVLKYPEGLTWMTKEYKVEVKVYSLGTNCWKTIGEFPFDGAPFSSGTFASGTIY